MSGRRPGWPGLAVARATSAKPPTAGYERDPHDGVRRRPRAGRSSRGQQQLRATGCRGGRSPGTLDATRRRPPPSGEDGGLSPTTGREAGDVTPEPSSLRRTEAPGRGAYDAPAAGRQRPRSIAKRPSDRRGPRRIPGAAKCVRSVDDQCVLQFTLVLAASCVLHRRTSRVIHR